jgi:hypothetical protein
MLRREAVHQPSLMSGKDGAHPTSRGLPAKWWPAGALEAKALAGLKGYVTTSPPAPDGTSVTTQFVIDAYIEKVVPDAQARSASPNRSTTTSAIRSKPT